MTSYRQKEIHYAQVLAHSTRTRTRTRIHAVGGRIRPASSRTTTTGAEGSGAGADGSTEFRSVAGAGSIERGSSGGPTTCCAGFPQRSVFNLTRLEFCACYSGWFRDSSANEWFYIFPKEGGIIYSINDLYTSQGLQVPCGEGYWIGWVVTTRARALTTRLIVTISSESLAISLKKLTQLKSGPCDFPGPRA